MENSSHGIRAIQKGMRMKATVNELKGEENFNVWSIRITEILISNGLWTMDYG